MTGFSRAFVVTALPMRRPLILEASTVLPVWNIYAALSMEMVNVCLAFLQPKSYEGLTVHFSANDRC